MVMHYFSVLLIVERDCSKGWFCPGEKELRAGCKSIFGHGPCFVEGSFLLREIGDSSMLNDRRRMVGFTVLM